MSVMGRGFLSLLFWLIVGVGLTELTVLALNLIGEGLSDGLNMRIDGRRRA